MSVCLHLYYCTYMYVYIAFVPLPKCLKSYILLDTLTKLRLYISLSLSLVTYLLLYNIHRTVYITLFILYNIHIFPLYVHKTLVIICILNILYKNIHNGV